MGPWRDLGDLHSHLDSGQRASVQSRLLSQPPLPLFDFSGFNSITDVAIPPADDRSHTVKWFREPSHYKKAAGDLIPSRVLDYASPEPIPDDFGIKISPDTIEDWLVKTRAAGQQYRAAEPGEAAIAKGAVDRAMEGQDGANCAAYMPLLIEASDDLQRGDRTGAEKAIASAEAIDR